MFNWRETKQYRKDIKKYRHLRNYLVDLENVRIMLIGGQKIPDKYRNHQLQGNDLFDCHVRPDFVLLYLKDEKQKNLVFVRIGSHSELGL